MPAKTKTTATTAAAPSAQTHTLKHPHRHGGVLHEAGTQLSGLTAEQVARIKRAEARTDAEAAKAAPTTEEAK